MRYGFIVGIVVGVLTLGMDGIAESPRQSATQAARQIDQILAGYHETRKAAFNPLTTDEQFARRVYLDIVGRIPTYRELTEFLDSTDAQKRNDLIDSLLDSDGYVAHTFNYWANLLRVKTVLVQNVGGLTYMEWIKDAIRTNRPYDRFVFEMLTAEGHYTDNGAVGYYLRDDGMPLDNLSNTVRLFLGTQIGCAQCHDDPYDQWSQYEFYELAAYTYPTRTRKNYRGQRQLRKAIAEANLSPLEQRRMRLLIGRQKYYVHDSNRPLRLPHDYKYKDASPRQLVPPHTLFGDDAPIEKGQSPREAFARWLTAPSNPRFTQVIANRWWARAMGIGLVEPVDAFSQDNPSSVPALLDFLEGYVQKSGYNLKQLGRAIYYSRTYQSQAGIEAPDAPEPYAYPGPLLRRMSAEQMWDSLVTLQVGDPDLIPAMPTGRDRRLATETIDLENVTAEDLIAHIRQDHTEIDAMKPRDRRRDRRMGQRQRRQFRGVYRSSNGVAPARAGSILDQFGASDRELIDSQHTNPTIMQPLTLLNDRSVHRLATANSALHHDLKRARDRQAKIRIAFMSILGRHPAEHEQQLALREFAADSKSAMRNIILALLNTQEFLFVQ